MWSLTSILLKSLHEKNWHNFQWDEYEATKPYLEQLDLIIQVGKNICNIWYFCNIWYICNICTFATFTTFETFATFETFLTFETFDKLTTLKYYLDPTLDLPYFFTFSFHLAIINNLHPGKLVQSQWRRGQDEGFRIELPIFFFFTHFHCRPCLALSTCRGCWKRGWVEL